MQAYNIIVRDIVVMPLLLLFVVISGIYIRALMGIFRHVVSVMHRDAMAASRLRRVYDNL